jgi:hypothetical protein
MKIELSESDLKRIGAALAARTMLCSDLETSLIAENRVEQAEAISVEREACAELHVRIIKAQTG